jgi:hypothetical protein
MENELLSPRFFDHHCGGPCDLPTLQSKAVLVTRDGGEILTTSGRELPEVPIPAAKAKATAKATPPRTAARTKATAKVGARIRLSRGKGRK